MNSRSFTAVAVAVAAAVSCGDDSGHEADVLAESAVGVVASGCSLADTVGSGVVVGAPGQVVTVAHTLRGARDVTVVDSSGDEFVATVVAFDKDSDLAVLDVPSLAAPPLSIGDVELGPGRLLVWDRDTGTSAASVDVVKRLRITIEDIYVEDVVERTGLEIAGQVEIGNSGGAVVSGGDVVGILYASSRVRDRIGFATDGDEMRDVLLTVSGSAVPTGRCR